MSENRKTFLLVVAFVLAFEALKAIFGYGPALTVAIAALSFCVGALWGAGGKAEKPEDPA